MTPSEKAQYYSGKLLPAGTRFSTHFKAPIPDGFGFRAVEPMAYSAGHDAWFGLVEQLDSGRIARSGCAPEWVDWDSVPDPPNAGCPDPGTTVQKRHHGPCNEHCGCAGRVVNMVDPMPGKKRLLYKCACGQERFEGARFTKSFKCGDCAAQYDKRIDAPQSLDARIAAARAVTDEAEGAWMVPHGEGP